MAAGLIIKIIAPDDDYLGIDIHAANIRFAGSARIYAGLDELSAFATQIGGFPVNPQDERTYEFGNRDRSFVGGYCRLRFHCVDQAGHAAIEVILEDDHRWHSRGIAELSFRVEAAEIDRFLQKLRKIEQARSGVAELPSTA